MERKTGKKENHFGDSHKMRSFYIFSRTKVPKKSWCVRDTLLPLGGGGGLLTNGWYDESKKNINYF